ELSAAPAIEARLGYLEGFALIFGIAASDMKLLLGAAQFEISASDFTNDADLHITAVFFGGLNISGRSFDVAPDAPENIKLPGGVETRVIKFEIALGKLVTKDTAFAEAFGSIAGVGIDDGIKIGLGEMTQLARFAQIGGGNAQIEVCANGKFD